MKVIKTKHILVALSICLFLVILLPLGGCTTRSNNSQNKTDAIVDINDYTVAKCHGFDGYGTWSVDVDYERLIQNANTNAENKDKAMNIINNFQPLNVSLSDNDKLANNDVVIATWERSTDVISALEELLEIQIESSAPYEFCVNGLLPLVECDPFEYLICNTNKTVTGHGEAEFGISVQFDGVDFCWAVAHNGENGALSNGDTLTLTISEAIDEDRLAKDFGIRLSRQHCEYTVNGLCDKAVDGAVLEYLAQNHSETFNAIINNWVVSGLNDKHPRASDRTYRPYGYMYYTNNDSDNAMLIAIYEIQDAAAELNYYTFIGLKGSFAYDNAGVYMADGNDLPTDFIYYEKETIRYSETFGWGQGDEVVGFLYNKEAYAGHKTINDIVNYIELTYGSDFDNRYVNQDISTFVPKR